MKSNTEKAKHRGVTWSIVGLVSSLCPFIWLILLSIMDHQKTEGSFMSGGVSDARYALVFAYIVTLLGNFVFIPVSILSALVALLRDERPIPTALAGVASFAGLFVFMTHWH